MYMYMYMYVCIYIYIYNYVPRRPSRGALAPLPPLNLCMLIHKLRAWFLEPNTGRPTFGILGGQYSAS